MPISFIPFDGWKPSGGIFGEGWATVNNLYSRFGSWTPVSQFHDLGAGVADTLRGGHVHQWATGAGSTSYDPDAQTIFTGSDTKLYTVAPSTGAFTDVSKAGGYGPHAAAWRFATVGNDVYACNWLDPLQRRTANAGLFATGPVSTFVPVPRFQAPVREHLLVANLNQAGRFQDEVAWSDADNPTNFDAPTLTSTSIAGSKRLTSAPGQIYGLVGGQYALAFKRKSIFYLEYTGTSQVFRPDVLSPYVGTAYPSSIITSRYGIFFLGSDGFYKLQGLSEPVKISPPGVDQVLLDGAFTSFVTLPSAAQEDLRLYGFQHPHMPLIGWALQPNPTLGASSLILYDPVADQWSKSDTFYSYLQWVVSRPFGSNINAVLAALTTDGAGNSHYAPWNTALALPPVMELRYRPANFADANEFQQSTIHGILPMFSKNGGTSTPALTASVTVEAMLDPMLDKTTTETRPASQRNIPGWYPFQSAGRLFRITINCAAEVFDHFDGIWVDQELLK